MNHKRTWIILLLPVISILAVIFYLKFNPPRHQAVKTPVSLEDIAMHSAKLEAKIQQLHDLLQAVVALNRSLNASSRQEKKEKLDLEKTLKDTSGKNEALLEELTQAKVALALTQPIKQKMNEAETLLPKLNLAPGKEKEIKQRLQQIQKTLSSIDSQLPAFLKENKSYKEEAEDGRQQLSKKEEDIINIKKALEARLKEQEAITQNLKNVSLELKRAQNANSSLGAHAESLKKAHDGLQGANASLSKELDGLKKDLQNTRAILTQSLKEKESAGRQLDQERLKAEESIKKQADQEETLKAFERETEFAQKELEALKKQLTHLTKDKESLLEELEESDNALEDIQKLQDEIGRLKKTLARAEEEKINLSEKAASAAAEVKNTRKLRDEITELNRQLEQLTKEYAEIKNAYASTQETIAQNELELGKRANKILIAEERRAETQAKLSELQLKAEEIERASALLREQNVAAQLEREAFRGELNNTKLRLSELEGQASLISNILKGAQATIAGVSPEGGPEAGAAALKEESKKIELKIYPGNEFEVVSDAKN